MMYEGLYSFTGPEASVPISPALDPIPLVVCWRAKSDSPPRDAFLQLVRERAAAIQDEWR